MRLRVFTSLAILAAIALACTQKEPVDSIKDGRRTIILTSILPEDAPLTKMLRQNSSSDKEWESTDEIAVHIKDINGDPYYIQGTSLGEGLFQVELYEGDVRDYYAIYPYAWADSENYADNDANKPLKVKLPSTYSYNTITGKKFMVGMIAQNDPTSNNLFWDYLCGCLRLTIKGVRAGTKSLSVLFDKCVTGSFDVEIGRETYISVNNTDTPKALTINFSGSGAAADGDYVVNIPLPTGTYASIAASALDANSAVSESGSGQFAQTVAAGGLYEFSLTLQSASPISTVTTTPMDVVTIDIQDGNHNNTWN